MCVNLKWSTAAAALGVAAVMFTFSANASDRGLGGGLGGLGGGLGGLGGGLGGVGGLGGLGGAVGVGTGAQSGKSSAIGAGRGSKANVGIRIGNWDGGNPNGQVEKILVCDQFSFYSDDCSEKDGGYEDASYAPDNTVPSRKLKPRIKTAVKLQLPEVKKTAPPKTIVRLNIEKPADESVEKPKLLLKKPEVSVPKPEVAIQKPQPSLEKVKAKPPALVSCEKASSIIGSYGFTAVTPSDCAGNVYSFDASRGGKSFAIKLDAVKGDLIEVQKLQ